MLFLKEDTGAQPHVCQWTLRSQVVEKVTGELVLPQRSNSCTQCMSPLWLLLPPPHGPHALWAAIVESLETALPPLFPLLTVLTGSSPHGKRAQVLCRLNALDATLMLGTEAEVFLEEEEGSHWQHLTFQEEGVQA